MSQAIATLVLDRIGRAGFPADLGSLSDLPDDEARHLLTELVRKVLTGPASGQTRALAQLNRVQAAVNSSGRDVRSDLPDELLTAPAHLLGIGARLLPLIDAAQIEELVIAAGSAELTAAWQNTQPRMHDPASLTNLLRLLQPAASGEERAIRGDDGPPAPARRTAHPRLEAPGSVDPGAVFELRVGLAERPSPGVEQPGGDGLRVPAGRFTLTVKLLLDGFVILGSAPTLDLVADAGDPYPYAVVRLRALDDPAYEARRKIVAAYQLGEQLLGLAFRWVTVGAPDAAEEGSAARGRVWVLDTGDTHEPDLSVQVVSGNNRARPTLMWLFSSPHRQVAGSGGWISHGRAEDAAEWSRIRFRGVQARRDQPDLTDYLRGVGAEVRALVPPALWQALRAAGTVTPNPAVLLGTTDPYLPWELALLPASWNRPHGEVLGGYAAVGRWIHPGEATTPAPAARIEARRMAVVAGAYAGGRRLPEAEQEAADLVESFGATSVQARSGDVTACLTADPAYEVVHFAVHGNFDAAGGADGILMVDGVFLSPVSVRGLPPGGVRFVFLNACQLGQAQSLLGEPNGMVPSFVDLGADAVVAPLWKVDDAVAREVAAGLYETLRHGGSPAEYFRRQRQESHGREGQPYGTRLAYLYFGHPRLAVTWSRRGNEQ